MTDTIPAPQPTTSTNQSPALAFTLDRVRMNPDITFLEVRDAAKLADLVIYPIVFAKARSMLGLGPAVQRRRRIQLEPVAEQPPTPDHAVAVGPPVAVPAEPSPISAPAVEMPAKAARKPRLSSAPSASLALDELVAYVQSVVEERDRLRAALEEIRRVVQHVTRSLGGR